MNTLHLAAKPVPGRRAHALTLRILLGMLFALASFAVYAVDESDLLPPESAFP